MREIEANFWDYANKPHTFLYMPVCCGMRRKIVVRTNINGDPEQYIKYMPYVGTGLGAQWVARYPGHEEKLGSAVRSAYRVRLLRSLVGNNFQPDNLMQLPIRNKPWNPIAMDKLATCLYDVAQHAEQYPMHTHVLPRIGCGGGEHWWGQENRPEAPKLGAFDMKAKFLEYFSVLANVTVVHNPKRKKRGQ
jgi:hypothetical protein